jgi:hypothetical protein
MFTVVTNEEVKEQSVKCGSSLKANAKCTLSITILGFRPSGESKVVTDQISRIRHSSLLAASIQVA